MIENVVGASREMQSPITLAGGMFGLGVERPRLFESNVPVTAPKYRRAASTVGVYGKRHDGRLLWTRSDGTQLRAARSLDEGRVAMGIDWMAWHELTEAIPPAYTEHIGRQILQHLTPRSDATIATVECMATGRARRPLDPDVEQRIRDALRAKELADAELRDAVLAGVATQGSVRVLADITGMSTNTISRWKREAHASRHPDDDAER